MSTNDNSPEDMRKREEHARLAAMVEALAKELTRQGVVQDSDIDILALAKAAVSAAETSQG